MLYITYTDEELKQELAAIKSDYRSVITKWQAGDTTVEKTKSGLESRLAALNSEILLRPSLARLVQRERNSIAVASFR